MARIFITGSADGLGQLAARRLIADGHEVVVHGRSPERAQEALDAVGAAAATHADLASLAQTRALADQANAAGPFDAVIHNAGIYLASRKVVTEDGLAHVFQINTLAPYLLTALIERPQRLIYTTSGLHRSGDASLEDLQWEERTWSAMQAYSDTKLHDALLAAAVARLWPGVVANAVDPGWVPTKMGGASASDDLDQGYETQVLLAAGEAPDVANGSVLYHREPEEPHPAVSDPATQDRLLAACAELTGETL